MSQGPAPLKWHRGEFKIAVCIQGEPPMQACKGLVSSDGNWGIKGGGGGPLTHVPSGRKVRNFHTVRKAKEFVEELRKVDGWESVEQTPKQNARMREVAKRREYWEGR